MQVPEPIGKIRCTATSFACSNHTCSAKKGMCFMQCLLSTVKNDNPDIGYLLIFGMTLLDEPEISELCLVCLMHGIIYTVFPRIESAASIFSHRLELRLVFERGFY